MSSPGSFDSSFDSNKSDMTSGFNLAANIQKPARKFKTTLLVAYCIAFTGACFILLSVIGSEVLHWRPLGVAFVRDLGLLMTAVMAGTILHEKLLRDDMFEEWNSELNMRLQSVVIDTSVSVHKLFCEKPPQMTGLRLLDPVRRNSAAYYSWVTNTQRQELFFAGRSVLHRIDADVRYRTGSSAEEVLLRRLKESSKITILFLDPRMEIIARLAEEEGERWESVLGNIATSIGITKRLYALLQEHPRSLPGRAHLSIRIYNQIPYFAYHRMLTDFSAKQDEQVIVGFYFLSMEGSSSAAYEVVDAKTKKTFGDHFLQIGAKSVATSLLEFDGARGAANFNSGLFQDLRIFLQSKLGDKTDDFISGI